MGAGSSGPKYLDEIHTPSGEGFINQEKINIFLIVFIILLNILLFSYLFGKKRYKD
jgi:hypothetical protein